MQVSMPVGEPRSTGGVVLRSLSQTVPIIVKQFRYLINDESGIPGISETSSDMRIRERGYSLDRG